MILYRNGKVDLGFLHFGVSGDFVVVDYAPRRSIENE